jgi:hypothetical protein
MTCCHGSFKEHFMDGFSLKAKNKFAKSQPDLCLHTYWLDLHHP